MSHETYHDHATIPAALHEADDCARWLAQREAELSLTVEGTNEGERKARLSLALAADERAETLREGLRVAQEHVARLEADELYLRDRRRANEWAARERLGLLGENER